MTNALRNLFPDYWWRFSRYEIRDGYMRPTASATLERYEPWKQFRVPFGKNPVTQPYHSLLELVAAVDDDPLRLGEHSQSLITDWCRDHGLLGVLPHRAEMVVLEREAGVSRRFYRETGGWRAISTQEQLAPGVLMRRLGRFELEFLPLSNYGRFFPDVPNDGKDAFRYPCPFSEQFWRSYAEPVADFMETAKLLKIAVDGPRTLKERRKVDSGSVQNSGSIMQSLTSSVQTVPYIQKNRFVVGWACYSLLSSFAMMATFDLASQRILICSNTDCGSWFVTKAHKARYCSARCRGNVQMRKYRKNLKKAGL